MKRDLNLPLEFRLAAACCMWPPSNDRAQAIQSTSENTIDWPRFMRVVNRQRIAALVHSALTSSRVQVPASIKAELASHAQQIARQNLLSAAESVRLQSLFDSAQIPVVFFKGVTLAQLAYGSLSLKHGKDIDILVPPGLAETALQILERDGYGLSRPAEELNEAQRRALIRYGKEVALIHRTTTIEVELHWKLMDNPLLLRNVDIHSPTQDVRLFDGGGVRTLAETDLFAYLCVHGAIHAWSRLKWLADLNAFISGHDAAEIECFYHYADTKGAGFCAGQALSLCRDFLQLKVPPSLASEFRQSRRLRRLSAIAIDAMVGPDAETELIARPFATYRTYLAWFLLGRGWGYFLAQCRNFSVGLGDVLCCPLPSYLHFLYPFLRLPLWLSRRVRYRGRGAPLRAPNRT